MSTLPGFADDPIPLPSLLVSNNNEKKRTTFQLSSFLVIRLGLEPRTPTLKVLCSTCCASESVPYFPLGWSVKQCSVPFGSTKVAIYFYKPNFLSFFFKKSQKRWKNCFFTPFDHHLLGCNICFYIFLSMFNSLSIPINNVKSLYR